MLQFTARTADELWIQLARCVRNHDGTTQQSSRDGPTLELLHCCLVLEDPLERWMVNRRPAMNPAFALAEVVWILNGRNDSAFLNFWNPKLPRYQGSGDTYEGAYGFRLRRQFGVDQLRKACDALTRVPDSRQVVLQIWNPASDLPIEQGVPRNPDVPCNICSMVKLRSGRLEWVQVMRSNDLVLGLPHNMVQFTYLQEMMSAWLGCETGPYHHISDSLHVYERDIGSLDGSATVPPDPNTDRWRMGLEQSLDLMEGIADRMDSMRVGGVSEARLDEVCRGHDLPEAASNMLAIIGADAARRHGHLELAGTLAGRCTNPALVQMWTRWRVRLEDRSVHEREPSRRPDV